MTDRAPVTDHGEPIDRETAHRLIDQVDVGWLVVAEERLLPTLGDVSPREHETELVHQTYRFGDEGVLATTDERRR